MRLGLVSDTHIPEACPELPASLYEALAGVDLILHAGDLHILDVLDWLEGIAPVLAARGNGEGSIGRPPIGEDPRLKECHVIQAGGLSIGLVHAFPLPEDAPWLPPGEMARRIFGRPLDVVVCGDTHVARIDRIEGTLVVNPGSPTFPNNRTDIPGTVALLEIAHGRAEARIVSLASVR